MFLLMLGGSWGHIWMPEPNKGSGMNWKTTMQPWQPCICMFSMSLEVLWRTIGLKSSGDFEAPGSMSPWIVPALWWAGHRLVARCTEDNLSALVGYAWQCLFFPGCEFQEFNSNPQDWTWHDILIHPYVPYTSIIFSWFIRFVWDALKLQLIQRWHLPSILLRPKSTGGCWAAGILTCQTRPRKVNLFLWKMHEWTWDEDGRWT